MPRPKQSLKQATIEQEKEFRSGKDLSDKEGYYSRKKTRVGDNTSEIRSVNRMNGKDTDDLPSDKEVEAANKKLDKAIQDERYRRQNSQ